MKLFLFDFDGTITKKDSMIEFLKFIYSKKPILLIINILTACPFLLIYFLGFISNETSKKYFLRILLRSFKEEQLKQFGNEFYDYFKKNFKNSAVNFINNIKKNKEATICIVTASLDIWMEPISRQLDIDIICTNSKFRNNHFWGFSKNNCYGIQKVNRLKVKYNLERYDEIFAFGDSIGDKEMLNIADMKYYKYFH